MKSVAVVQARTNSSRLPGKVLLPVGGMPVAALAAKRAANTGKQTIVATSTEASDDGLVEILHQNGVTCYRGSLENVLARVVGALSGRDDETIVFRLTADNVIPDGALLDELETAFINHGLDYLCCNGLPSGLPYGMSAEVTRLRHLRDAHMTTADTYDCEHVTPYIIRKFGAHYFQKYQKLGLGHLRCTIDCLDDYLAIQKIFSEVCDPINVPALNLVAKLKGQRLQPIAARLVPRLVFGAVQLGLPYGISNKHGQPGLAESQQLLKIAISNGIEYIDTARGYGKSEEVIGRSLADGWSGRARIVTKLSPLADCPPDGTPAVVDSFVDASLYQSMSALFVSQLDVLLLHRASHIYDWKGRVWQRLVDHRNARRVGVLGVSVQTPTELLDVLHFEEVGHIQLPFNILDWRWDNAITKLIDVKAVRPLVVHVRSVLLQGLLPSDDPVLWRRACVDEPMAVLAWLKDSVVKYNRRSVADLCIGFVNALPWVDGIAIGMETSEQLLENIALFSCDPLSLDNIKEICKSRPRLSKESLNPALWTP